MSSQPPRLLDDVRAVIRARHYSRSTEDAYIAWIRRFILFHGKRHPKEMAVDEVEAFLTHLAVSEHVAASTQNQALSALLFLYRHFLQQPLDASIDAVRAKRPKRLPTVLTRAEVRQVFDAISGAPKLMAMLLYGSGLRLGECVSLRVKDIDFDRCELTVREAKGNKDRVTMLPAGLVDPLRHHLDVVRSQRLPSPDRPLPLAAVLATRESVPSGWLGWPNP